MDYASISIIDLLLFVTCLFYAMRGLFRGIVRALFSLTGTLCSYLVATLYFDFAVKFLNPLLGSPEWINLASFIATFIAVQVVFFLLEVLFIRLFVSKDRNRDLAGIFALLMGLIEGFLICSIVLWMLQQPQLSPPNSEFLKSSILQQYFTDYNPLLYGLDAKLRG